VEAEKFVGYFLFVRFLLGFDLHWDHHLVNVVGSYPRKISKFLCSDEKNYNRQIFGEMRMWKESKLFE